MKSSQIFALSLPQFRKFNLTKVDQGVKLFSILAHSFKISAPDTFIFSPLENRREIFLLPCTCLPVLLLLPLLLLLVLLVCQWN